MIDVLPHPFESVEVDCDSSHELVLSQIWTEIHCVQMSRMKTCVEVVHVNYIPA